MRPQHPVGATLKTRAPRFPPPRSPQTVPHRCHKPVSALNEGKSTLTTVYTFGKRQRPPRPLLHKSFGVPDPDMTRNAASVGRVASEALTELAAQAQSERCLSGLRVRSPGMVLGSLDFVTFTASMQRMSKYLRLTTKGFARQEILGTAGQLTKAAGDTSGGASVLLDGGTSITISTSLDAIEPLAIAYSERRTGQLIREITEQTRENVQLMVTSSLNGNMTVDQLGRRLRQIIPLSSADGALLERFQTAQFERLLSEGKTIGQAAQVSQMLTEKLGVKKLAARANLIARTELVIASNQGRYAGWKALDSTGQIDPRSVKEWVAAPTACPLCLALHGQLAPWQGTFPNGLEMPPDHPACRCSAVILPPDDAIIAEMERQFTSRPEDER